MEEVTGWTGIVAKTKLRSRKLRGTNIIRYKERQKPQVSEVEGRMNLFRMADATTGAGGMGPHSFGAVVRAIVPAPVRRMKGRFDPNARVLGRLGTLEVRLARSRDEVKAAQRLRYHVFYEEMSAKPSMLQKVTRRDKDGFDRYCDHLLVVDTSRGGALSEQIVGTYRLMVPRARRWPAATTPNRNSRSRQ